ncbi:hypothetical protein Tco_0441793 [Tanacetum coccineum]
MESLNFDRYWSESERMIPRKGDLHDYWRDISTDGDFLGPPPSYTLIRDPVLRLCHRMIAHSIAGRSRAPEKVTVTNLFYLRGMDVGSVNIPHLLGRYLSVVLLLTEEERAYILEIRWSLVWGHDPREQLDARWCPWGVSGCPIIDEGARAESGPQTIGTTSCFQDNATKDSQIRGGRQPHPRTDDGDSAAPGPTAAETHDPSYPIALFVSIYRIKPGIIMEYLANISKRRAFWILNEDILKTNDFDNEYAVSIKEYTAYPCLHSPKTTKERRSIRPIQKNSIRRIQDIVCEYSGRYQTWSLLQETPIRRIQSLGYATLGGASIGLSRKGLFSCGEGVFLEEKGEEFGLNSMDGDVVPKVEDVSFVDGVLEGTFGGECDN